MSMCNVMLVRLLLLMMMTMMTTTTMMVAVMTMTTMMTMVTILIALKLMMVDLCVQVFASYLAFCGIGLKNAQLYGRSLLENRRNQVRGN